MLQNDGLSPGMYHQKCLTRSPLQIPAHFVNAGLCWTNVGIDYFYLCYLYDEVAASGDDDSSFLPMRIFCLSHETMGAVKMEVVGRRRNGDEDCCRAHSRSHWIDSLYLGNGTFLSIFSRLSCKVKLKLFLLGERTLIPTFNFSYRSTCSLPY